MSCDRSNLAVIWRAISEHQEASERTGLGHGRHTNEGRVLRCAGRRHGRCGAARQRRGRRAGRAEPRKPLQSQQVRQEATYRVLECLLSRQAPSRIELKQLADQVLGVAADHIPWPRRKVDGRLRLSSDRRCVGAGEWEATRQQDEDDDPVRSVQSRNFGTHPTLHMSAGKP